MTSNNEERCQLLKEITGMGIACVRLKNGKSLANASAEELKKIRDWFKKRQAKTCCDALKERNDK